MAIKFKVGTTFGGKDETSRIFKRMGDSADKFGRRSKKAFGKASTAARGFKSVTKSILTAQLISKGISLVTRGVTAAATSFLSFDQAITSASSRFSDLNLETKKGQKTLEALKKTAREVGATTEFGADQAAQGLDFLALASFTAEQSMKLLPGVANLATVANVGLAEATDIASDSLGAFGLQTDDTAQLTKNFTRIQDVLAKTTTTSNTNLTSLFETVKSGAPDFIQAGQSLETFATFAGVMANSGKKGSKAGLVMKNMMVRLAKPSKEAARVMERLGLKVKDSNGNFRDAIDILGDFGEAIKNKGSADRTATVAAVFGVEIQTGVNLLLAEGTEKLKEYRKRLIDSGGAAKKAAGIIRSSLINRIESLKSALTEVSFKFFEDFAGPGKKFITGLTEAVRKFDVTPIKEFFGFVKKLAEDSGLIDLLTIGFENLGPVVKTMWGIAKPILKAMAFTIGTIVEGIKFIFNLKTKEEAKQAKKLEKERREDRVKRAETPRINRTLRDLQAFMNPNFEARMRSLLEDPNAEAAKSAVVNVNLETNVTGSNTPKVEQKVNGRTVDRSATGPNNVLATQ